MRTPEVLRDLRDTVLPIYRESYLREFRRDREEPKSDQEALDSLNRFYVPLAQAIVDWATRHRLVSSENAWIEAQAGLCLWAWGEHPGLRNSLLIPPLVSTGTARFGRGPTFDFSEPGWNIEFHSWTEFAKETNERFQEHLKAYRALRLRNWQPKRVTSPCLESAVR